MKKIVRTYEIKEIKITQNIQVCGGINLGLKVWLIFIACYQNCALINYCFRNEKPKTWILKCKTLFFQLYLIGLFHFFTTVFTQSYIGENPKMLILALRSVFLITVTIASLQNSRYGFRTFLGRNLENDFDGTVFQTFREKPFCTPRSIIYM